MLSTVAPLAKVAATASPMATRGGMTPAENRAFVENLVASIGGGHLAASEAAERAWAGALDRGRSTASVARQILRSPEARSAMVERAYEDLLDRDPSASETRSALRMLGRRDSLRPVIAGIVGGIEYFRRSGGTIDGLRSALVRDLVPALSMVATASAGDGTAVASPAARSRAVRWVMARPGYSDPVIAASYEGITGLQLDASARASLTARVDAAGGLSALLARIAARPEVASALASRNSLGLAVKRVPGALQDGSLTSTAQQYTSIVYAATPFQVENIDARQVGAGDTDFWTINLNPTDSVAIQAIDPTTQQANPNITIYIWQASGTIADAAGVPAPGTTYTLVQQASGKTYYKAPASGPLPTSPTIAGVDRTPGSGGASLIVGFALAGQPAPDPTTASAPQATATDGSAVTFGASFQTYPGVQTDMIAMLNDYHDPAYRYATPDVSLAQINDWPTFTAGQAAAYNIFTYAASQGDAAANTASGAAPGSSSLTNFTDFRIVGDQSDPRVQASFLSAVWDPIRSVISDLIIGATPKVSPTRTQADFGVPSVLIDGRYYLYGYTPDTFAAQVLDPIKSLGRDGGPSATDFQKVADLIESANSARTALAGFIKDYDDWTTKEAAYFGSAASTVATNLSHGITDPSGQTPLMIGTASVLTNATNGLNLVSSVTATLDSGLAILDPEIMPIMGLLSGITSFAACITGDFASNSTAQKIAEAAGQGAADAFQAIDADSRTSNDIIDAGDALDTNNRNLLLNSSFDMTAIQSSMFSNYGLLQAFSDVAFPSLDAASISPDFNKAVNQVRSDVTQSYELSAYLSLTPLFFEWKNATDMSVKDTTLGLNLNNLIPLNATIVVSGPEADTGTYAYNYNDGLWYGLGSAPGAAKPWRVNASQSDLESSIRSMLVAFQGGEAVASYGAGSPNWVEQGTSLAGGHWAPDWVAPIPFAGSTAPLTPNTSDGLTMGRFYSTVPVVFAVTMTEHQEGHSYVGTSSVSGTGYDAMEWGLYNESTKKWISTNAAVQLFGTPDYSTARLVSVNGQMSLAYDTPSGALANVADVFFSRGGWDVPGGGDAGAGYISTTSGAVTGDASALNLWPTTAEPTSYLYLVTPLPSTSNTPTRPLPATGNLGTVINTPASESYEIPAGSYITSPSGRYYMAFQTDGNIVIYDTRAANEPVWASNTYGQTDARFYFTPSSQLMILAKDGTTIWQNIPASSSPGINKGPYLTLTEEGAAVEVMPAGPGHLNPEVIWTSQPASQGVYRDDAPESNWIGLPASNTSSDRLQGGQSLSAGRYLLSRSGQFALVMQSNSQLVIYDLWDRNIVPIWTYTPLSPSQEHISGAYLPQMVAMGTDGNLTMTEGDTVVFQRGQGVAGSYLRMQDDGNLVIYTASGGVCWASNTMQT